MTESKKIIAPKKQQSETSKPAPKAVPMPTEGKVVRNTVNPNKKNTTSR